MGSGNLGCDLVQFSRKRTHAASYHAHASVQAIARQWLWCDWPCAARGLVLDVGSGPVTAPEGFEAGTTAIALDQSLPMLAHASGYTYRVAADAAAMPFATGSVQYIGSSMAMQWIGVQALAEWHRLLEPRGRMAMVVPIRGTLARFQACLGDAGLVPRTLPMQDERVWIAALREIGFWVTLVEIRHIQQPYSDRRQLVRALTRIGAAGDAEWSSRDVRRATLAALDRWCASGTACLEYVLLRVEGQKSCGIS